MEAEGPGARGKMIVVNPIDTTASTMPPIVRSTPRIPITILLWFTVPLALETSIRIETLMCRQEQSLASKDL
jgi:hypothetical protein